MIKKQQNSLKKNYFLNSQALIRTVPGTGVGFEDMVSMETTSSFSLQVPSSSVIAAWNKDIVNIFIMTDNECETLKNLSIKLFNQRYRNLKSIKKDILFNLPSSKNSEDWNSFWHHIMQ